MYGCVGPGGVGECGKFFLRKYAFPQTEPNLAKERSIAKAVLVRYAVGKLLGEVSGGQLQLPLVPVTPIVQAKTAVWTDTEENRRTQITERRESARRFSCPQVGKPKPHVPIGTRCPKNRVH